ncbi:MAG: tyrosinase family protein [Pseudomonas sp.]
MGVRKNQKNLTAAEWKALIAAINAMHGPGAPAPAYRRFVSLHVEAMDMSHMDWSVHAMPMNGRWMPGKNFLTWHRRLLKLFEERIQSIDPTVSIPYWDSITDRSIPTALTDPSLLANWSVTRDWDASKLAAAADLLAVNTFQGTFSGFQTLLEGTVHGGTHNAVGGNMKGSSSPTDPLFWLHHAFIDKTWADWQASPNGKKPPTPSQVLKPVDMDVGIPFGVKVSSLLSINTLGYSYV